MERPVVEKAIAESEGRVVTFAELAGDVGYPQRFQKLDELFSQDDDRSPERLNTLLRDVSASNLSVSTAFLAAA